MLSQEENDFLTRVGPETPGGKLLRRYWHVVAAAGEITDAKPKKRVRVLGEDLVLYRKPNGTYSLVGEHCSHRGASLYYGFVEDDGIRCPYHGWKYDDCGRCVEQPFENPETGFKDKIQHPAYPVMKSSGLLYAYMGPARQAATVAEMGRAGTGRRRKKSRYLRSSAMQLAASHGKLR